MHSMHVIVLLPIKQFVVKPLSRENPHAKFTFFFIYIVTEMTSEKVRDNFAECLRPRKGPKMDNTCDKMYRRHKYSSL